MPEYIKITINNVIHNYILINILSNLIKQKLIDTTFTKIKEIVPKDKASNCNT